MSEAKLLTAKDAADVLGVSLQRVWELTRRKLIPFVKLGERQYRYSELALKEWIANGGNRNDSNLKDAA